MRFGGGKQIEEEEELQKYIKNDHNSLIFWPICIKFGMWVHSMGMNKHVKFEDPKSLIFGHLAKNVHMNCMGAMVLPLVISNRLFVNYNIDQHCQIGTQNHIWVHSMGLDTHVYFEEPGIVIFR